MEMEDDYAGEDQEISQEDAWAVISAYFEEKGLARQQLDSFDEFIQNTMQEIVDESADIEIRPESQHNPGHQPDFAETIYKTSFGQIYLSKPMTTESDGETATLFPKVARLSNLTYSAPLYVDVSKKVIKKRHDGEEVTETQDFGEVFIGKVPIMLQSSYCTLFQNSEKDLTELGECPCDQGGYFIINGSEKVLIAQEKMSGNHFSVFMKRQPNKYAYVAEVRSMAENQNRRPSNMFMRMLSRSSAKGGASGQYIRATFAYIRTGIPIIIVLRALVFVANKDIVEHICYDFKDTQMMEPLRPSLEEVFLIQNQQITCKGMAMTSWSDLPVDVLVLIAERLKKLEHFVAFGGVCKSWGLAAKKKYFKGLWLRQGTPYLMLPVRDEKEDTREFYSLYDAKIVASVAALKFKNTQCLESRGWLLVSEEDGSMCLFEPFSNIEIPLPHQTTFPGYIVPQLELHPHVYVHKMVLSSRPCETSDFEVMIICAMYAVAFWRPGDEAWIGIDVGLGYFRDITYRNGHFYAIDHLGYVWAFGRERNNQKVEYRIVTCLIDDGYNYMNKSPRELCKRLRPMSQRLQAERNELVSGKTFYILGTDHGSLLLIARTSRIWNKEQNRPYNSTSKFHVYEVDVHTGLWREIRSLGNMAVFIGLNSTVSVDASSFPAFFKANHIYFTDDDWETYFFYGEKEGGKDMGVYSLETGKIEQFYHGELLLSKISPSLWVTPCF